jgi:hypothetical protein
MSWNYRIVKKKYEHEVMYGIHEVYYDEDGSVSWTKNPIPAMNSVLEGEVDDPEEQKNIIRQELLKMLEACGKDIVDGTEVARHTKLSLGEALSLAQAYRMKLKRADWVKYYEVTEIDHPFTTEESMATDWEVIEDKEDDI